MHRINALSFTVATFILLIASHRAMATCTSTCEAQRYNCIAAADSAYNSCLSSTTKSAAQCQDDRTSAYEACSQQNSLCTLACGGSSGGGPSNGVPPGGHACFAGCYDDFDNCLDSGTYDFCNGIKQRCIQYCGG
jgi:hypothetical protein